MKKLLFLFAFAMTIASAAGQCGHSLFNLLATERGINPSSWTVTEFRAVADSVGSAHGIRYDRSGRNNLAIIAAVCGGGSDVSEIKTGIEDWTNADGVQFHFTGHFIVTPLNRPDTTVLDYTNYSVFYANGQAYDTIFHWPTDTVSTVSPAQLAVPTVSTRIETSEVAPRRFSMTCDLGPRRSATTLLDLYIETRHSREAMVSFEYVWRQFTQRQHARRQGVWGEMSVYNRSKPYWAWYWLTYNKGDREVFLVECGQSITIFPEAPKPQGTSFRGNGLAKRPSVAASHKACRKPGKRS